MSPSAATAASVAAAHYAEFADRTSAQWANQMLHSSSSSPEEKLVAARLLELRAAHEDLAVRAEKAERLAFNLGGDLLHALQAALVDPDPDHEPMHYIAQGWRRDLDQIALADCAEGRAVTDALAVNSLGTEG